MNLLHAFNDNDGHNDARITVSRPISFYSFYRGTFMEGVPDRRENFYLLRSRVEGTDVVAMRPHPEAARLSSRLMPPPPAPPRPHLRLVK